MEWNLSSLPDANFAGEEWRNLHRNCVPIASLENLEFSSVLLRFPFFFLLLLKRFSQIVRFLPSFLLEHCGYRRCLNEENSKGKDENLDRKRIEKRIVSILLQFENFFLFLTFLKSFDSCDHFFSGIADIIDIWIRKERTRIWIGRGSKKGSFRFSEISKFFLLLTFLKSFNSCHHFFFHCGYRCLNTKGKDKNLDRKKIEKRIISILWNFEIFFAFEYEKTKENLDRKRIEKRILVSILRNFLNVLFRTNSHDDFFLADTRLQTNCIDTYNKYEKGGKEGKRLKGIVLSYCNDTINVAIVCVSRNKVGNPCLLVLG